MTVSLFCACVFAVLLLGSSPHSALAHIHTVDKALSTPHRIGSSEFNGSSGDSSARCRNALVFGFGNLSTQVSLIYITRIQKFSLYPIVDYLAFTC